MVASNSTFRTHLGRVIRDLSRLLHAAPCCTAWYRITSLHRLSKRSCSLHVAGYNIVVDCQRGSLFPPLNSGANAVPASAPVIVFAIRSLAWDEWSYPQLLRLWRLSDWRIAELWSRPRCFSIKLHIKTQVFDRLGMSDGKSPRHGQNIWQ